MVKEYLNMSLLQIYYRVRQLKKVLKSVNIWWSYGQQVSDIFFFLTHSAGAAADLRRIACPRNWT